MVTLTACGNTPSNDSAETKKTLATEAPAKDPTLNDYMLIFNERMEKYLAAGKKNVPELEKLHLDFVPILKWEEYKGDEEYKKAALAAGTIVHRLQDVEGEEYDELLKTMKPAYIIFYAEYGGK